MRYNKNASLIIDMMHHKYTFLHLCYLYKTQSTKSVFVTQLRQFFIMLKRT